MDMGEFNPIARELAEATDSLGRALGVKSLIISTPDKTFEQAFLGESEPSDVRSISKVAVSLAIGAAMADGIEVRGERLSLETKIWPLFEGRVEYDTESLPKLRELRLRHLMSNSMGHAEGLMFRADAQAQDQDKLLDYIFLTPIEFLPGEHFSYSNAGWYLISAIVREHLELSLSTFVGKYLFDPLNIQDFSWKRYGKYEVGGSGLALYNRDLHKLGQLFRTYGAVGGRQIIPPDWLDTIRTPVMYVSEGQDPKRTLQYVAYGYGVWIAGNGIYYCDGAAGQYLIRVPDRDLVISTVGDVAEMNPITAILRELIE